MLAAVSGNAAAPMTASYSCPFDIPQSGFPILPIPGVDNARSLLTGEQFIHPIYRHP